MKHERITADFTSFADECDRQADLLEQRTYTTMERAALGNDQRVSDLRHIAHDARSYMESGCEASLRSVNAWQERTA